MTLPDRRPGLDADGAERMERGVANPMATVLSAAMLLRHSLGPWIERHAPGAAFDLQRRAEEVPVAEYLALARR